MISGGIEINWFAEIRLIQEAKDGDDHEMQSFFYMEFVLQNV